MTTRNDGFGYFCLGTAVGAVAAILLTPKSGSETRQYLRDKADESTNEVKARAEKLRNSANEALETGKKVAKQQLDKVYSAMDAGKQAFNEAASSHPV